MNVRQQILENILTEGIHLYAFVKDEDGNSKIIEDFDYPDKKSFENDLRANGYKVHRVSDSKDMYIMDHSDYRSVSEVESRINQIKKDKKNGYSFQSKDRELEFLEKLLKDASEVSLLEKADNPIKSTYNLWQKQVDAMSREQMQDQLNKLYSRYDDFDDRKDTNIPPREYVQLLKKMSYIEKKLGLDPRRRGRKLN